MIKLVGPAPTALRQQQVPAPLFHIHHWAMLMYVWHCFMTLRRLGINFLGISITHLLRLLASITLVDGPRELKVGWGIARTILVAMFIQHTTHQQLFVALGRTVKFRLIGDGLRSIIRSLWIDLFVANENLYQRFT